MSVLTSKSAFSTFTLSLTARNMIFRIHAINSLLTMGRSEAIDSDSSLLSSESSLETGSMGSTLSGVCKTARWTGRVALGVLKIALLATALARFSFPLIGVLGELLPSSNRLRGDKTSLSSS